MDRLLNLFRRLTQTAAPKGTRRQRRGRPALEGLEDRITPSNIIFEYDQPFLHSVPLVAPSAAQAPSVMEVTVMRAAQGLKSSPGADGVAANANAYYWGQYDIAIA